MPTLKTLTSLILVIITVLIVTVLLTRISKPVEVEAVGEVYNQFFGETSTENPLDYLTLEQGQLFLHVERLPSNVKLQLFVFPATPEHRREYTKESRPVRLTLPEEFLTVYAVSLTQRRNRVVYWYILIHPSHERIPFAEVEEGITRALKHNVRIGILRMMFSKYAVTHEGRRASLSLLLKPVQDKVCAYSFVRIPVSFSSVCRNEKGFPLLREKNTAEEDMDTCLLIVWDGRLPEGVVCEDDEEVMRMQREGGRLFLLFNLLSQLEEPGGSEAFLPRAGQCAERVRARDLLLSSLGIRFSGISEEALRRVDHFYTFYQEHVFFDPSASRITVEGCDVIIPLEGETRIWRIR